jgi:Tfp pilus assembly protein PilX
MSAMCLKRSSVKSQYGFLLVTAIFLLVILAALGAFILTISGTQQTSSALDVQGSRAYQAARAGIDWASYQLLINAGAPTLRQQTTGAGANPVTLTLGSLPQANNLLILVGGNNFGLDFPGGVTGGGVTSWSRATIKNNNSDAEIWYGITNGSSATVTLHGAAGAHLPWGNLSEWSGMNQTQGSVLDVTAIGTGTTATATTTPGITTTNANDLIIFDVGANVSGCVTFCVNWGTGPTPGTWTPMTGVYSNDPGPNEQKSWYSIVSTAGAYNPSQTIGGGGGWWDAAMAAFKAQSAAGAFITACTPGPTTQNVTGMGGTLSGFTAAVTCSSTTYTEGGATVTVYQITSTGAKGTVGTLDRVERQLQVTLTK